jgi:hypothetical protein
MADAITLKAGDRISISLEYDASGFELLASGMDFGLPEHENVWHSSEWADSDLLVRHRLKNRRWPMVLAVVGSDLAGTLADFNRAVNQARRYHIYEDVDKVYLEFTPDGGNTTYYDVHEIEYDQLDFMNYFNRQADEIKYGEGFSIIVVTDPWGYGDEEVLENYLGNPHFQENSGATSPGWSKYLGTETFSVETGRYLIGSQCQKIQNVETLGSLWGIKQDISCSTSESFAAYCWVNRSSDLADNLFVSVLGSGGANILATGEYNNATETRTGYGGKTWTKLEASGTTGTSDTTVTFVMYGPGEDAGHVYVDGCYFQRGTTTIPNGFVSYRSLKNHWDGGAHHINYFDTALIDGDLPAPADVKMTIQEAGYSEVIGLYTAKDENAGALTYRIEAEDLTDDGDGSVTADASSSGAQILRVTGSSSEWGYAGQVQGLDAGDLYGIRSVYVRAKCNNTTADFRVEIKGQNWEIETEENDGATSATEQLAGYWGLRHMGSVNIPISQRLKDLSSGNVDLGIETNFRGVATTFDFDYIYLLPTDQATIVKAAYYLGSSDVLYLDSDGTSTYYDHGTTEYDPSETLLGGALILDPAMQQRTFYFREGDPQLNLNNTTNWDVTTKITYRPRTEFFL